MGTPEFALFGLSALVDAGEDVCAVVTQTDKPSGRGMAQTPPPVKVYAEAHGIPVYQPKTLKDGAFADELAKIDPEMIVVVAYGKILPPYVLDYPKYGCINIHGSLLPRYRGAAPMQRAVMDGERVTGVTSMYMAEGLDTGDMLLKEEVEILDDDNFEDVHDKLGAAGARVLKATVDAAKRGDLHPVPQDDALATYAQKIEKEECRLDFSADGKRLHDKIRALSPFPLAYTFLPDGRRLKIRRAHFLPAAQSAPYGSVISAGRDGVAVSCRGGLLYIDEACPEGKKMMSAADLANGRQIAAGDLLGIPKGEK